MDIVYRIINGELVAESPTSISSVFAAAPTLPSIMPTATAMAITSPAAGATAAQEMDIDTDATLGSVSDVPSKAGIVLETTEMVIPSILSHSEGEEMGKLTVEEERDTGAVKMHVCATYGYAVVSWKGMGRESETRIGQYMWTKPEKIDR